MPNISPIPAPVVPPTGGQPGGLADKIARVIGAGFSSAVSTLLTPFAHAIRFAIETVMEDVETNLSEISRPLLIEVRDMPSTPASVKRIINEAIEPQHPAAAAILAPIVGAIAIALVLAAFAAVIDLAKYATNRAVHPFRMDFNTAILVKRRGLAGDPLTLGDLYDQGLSDERIAAMTDASERRLDAGALGQLALRGEMSSDQMIEELFRQGWKREHAQQLTKLLQIIPAPNDLIAMAVKEAWDDEFASLAGTDAGFGGAWVAAAKQLGLSEDWCRRYWRAHWQLPSPQMGFEMLHRGVISDADLDRLLKALDISPGWRDKLKQIAYNPYTRVDTRRMYNLGILDRAGVKRAYLDQGYDDAHAENLTEFTIRDATDTDKEATKSDILAGYSTGMLNKTESVDWLIALDFPRDLAEFYIAKEDAKKANSRKTRRVDAIKKLYIGGEIGVSEATTRLAALNLSSGEVSEYLDDWTIERENKIERPAAGQLETFLKQDVIDEAEYRNGLKLLGFSAQYVDWFTRSALGEKAEAARKAETSAKSEQERLRTSRVKSDYALAKASLDVDESTLQAAIAETQIAASNRRTRYQADLALARQTTSVAALKADAVADINYLQSQIDDLAKQDKQLRETISQENSAIDSLREAAAQFALETDAALLTATDDETTSALKSALKTYNLETQHSIAQHNVAIGQAEQDISSLATRETDLRNSIDARQAKLDSDLAIAQRVKSVADVEAEYRRDVAEFTRRLGELRDQLSDVRGMKAELAVTLQTQLRPGA